MKRMMSLPIAMWLAGICALPAAAQFPGFGIKGGVNLTEFVGGEADDDTNAGLNLGASIPLFRLGPVQFVPEVYYAQKGGEDIGTGEVCDPLTPSPDPAASCLLDFSIDYIEVPLLARVAFPIPGARGLSFYVQGGPTYAWKLECELSIESLAVASGSTERPCESDQFSDARTAIREADRGIALGGGLFFDVLGLGALNLDARVVRGLDRLRESESGEDLHNQAFTLMLGYSFGAPDGGGAGGVLGGGR